MLYLIPTPIGNLSDITLRAIEKLKEVDLILAEDTRVTKRLLNHLKISKPIQSFHQNNEHRRLNDVVAMAKDQDLAYVTDAGTPGISDPGFLLVRSCIQADIKVECLPGPTALIPALVVSGLPIDRFYFEGFLPQKKGRQTRLTFVSNQSSTVVLYESPHRIIKCIDQLIEHCGPDRKVCVVREISKMFEEKIYGSLQEVADQLKAKTSIKGEFVVVLEAKPNLKN